MELFGIYSEIIQQFEKQNLISVSEPPLGAFFERAMMALSLLRTSRLSTRACLYGRLRLLQGMRQT